MRELALFAGAGGSLLAGRLLGWTPVCAVEVDPWCQGLLRERWPGLPVYGDVREFDATEWRGRVDVVTAGWPCPPVSLAGKRLGERDPRWLWPEVVRVLREARPGWFLGENVRGLLSADAGRVFGGVLRDLAGLGFDAEWGVLSASSVGAPHRRERVWLVAHAERDELRDAGRRERRPGREGSAEPRDDGDEGASPDADGRRREGLAERHSGALAGEQGARRDDALRRGAWDWREAPPGVCRVPHGVPHRVDRLRALGNAWVPQCAAEAWRRLSERLQEAER